MVSVYKDGETFFCGGGIADVENGYEATPDTIYAIASVSKAFIATAICILADEGKVCLDDSVKKHLPGFEMHTEYITNNLTIRDALGHRSGLPRHDLMWLNNPDMSLQEIIDGLKYLPLAFPHRARMHYQNHMFALASLLVEKITGEPWQKFVEERIFKPIGMDSSYTRAEDYRDKGLKAMSEPYDYVEGEFEKIPFNNIDNVGCAGCLSSTVRDLDKWARLNLGRGELDGKRILSEDMAKNLHNPQMIIKEKEMMPYELPECDFTSYGLGWFVESYRGHKLVHHGGTIDGYKTLVGFLPNEGIAFSVLTNMNANQTPTALGYYICDLALGLSEIDWGTRFLDIVAKFKTGANDTLDAFKEKAKNAPPQAHKAEEYVGMYKHGAYGAMPVTLDKGVLRVSIMGHELELVATGYDTFYVEFPKYSACAPVKFDYDSDGKICKMLAKLDAMSDMIEFERVEE